MKLDSIFVRIGDQLRLVQNGLLAYNLPFDHSFRALSDVVREAKRHSGQKNVQELHTDLEWITQTILATSSLKKTFYWQGIRLGLLKDELGAYLLTVVLKDERDTLNHLLLGLHHDLEGILERSRKYNLQRTPGEQKEDKVLSNHINDTLGVLTDIRAGLQIPLSERGELKVIQQFSFLSERIRKILGHLKDNNYFENVQFLAFRKVLIHDWNAIVDLLVDHFEKIYTQKLKPKGKLVVTKFQGAEGIELR